MIIWKEFHWLSPAVMKRTGRTTIRAIKISVFVHGISSTIGSITQAKSSKDSS